MSRPLKPDAITMLAAMKPTVAINPPPSAGRARRTPERQPKPGARAGTRVVAGHFPDATLKALKHLMAEEDTTLQALLEEAISDLLVKKGYSKLTS